MSRDARRGAEGLEGPAIDAHFIPDDARRAVGSSPGEGCIRSEHVGPFHNRRRRRVHVDRKGPQGLDVSVRVGGLVVQGVPSFPDRERAAVRGPGTAVEAVRDRDGHAARTRSGQGDVNVGDVPAVRAQGPALAQDGDGRQVNADRSAQYDGQGVHGFRVPGLVDRMVLDDMGAVARHAEGSGIGPLGPAVDPIGDRLDAARRVGGAQGDGRGGEIAAARRGAGDLRQRGWGDHVDLDAHGMGRFDVPCDVCRVVVEGVGAVARDGDR